MSKPQDIEARYEANLKRRYTEAPAAQDEREALVRDIVSQHLTSLYVCTRVWDAWHVGTMSEDDFVPASETEFVEELTQALLPVLAARAPQAAPAAQPILSNSAELKAQPEPAQVEALAAEAKWAAEEMRKVARGVPIASHMNAEEWGNHKRLEARLHAAIDALAALAALRPQAAPAVVNHQLTTEQVAPAGEKR